ISVQLSLRVRLSIRRFGVPLRHEEGSDGPDLSDRPDRLTVRRLVERPAFLPGFEDEADRFFDRQRRVVQHERAFGRYQGRCAAIAIASVTRLELCPKTVEFSGNSL